VHERERERESVIIVTWLPNEVSGRCWGRGGAAARAADEKKGERAFCRRGNPD